MFFNELLGRGASAETPVVGLFVIGRGRRVSDRYDLDIFKLQKLLDVRGPLTPAPNDRNIYFFAGRDISRAAKNMPGDNGENSGCACGMS
jgi:hypothetical protein